MVNESLNDLREKLAQLKQLAGQEMDYGSSSDAIQNSYILTSEALPFLDAILHHHQAELPQDVVELVARAISKAVEDDEHLWPHFKAEAKAAIAAMGTETVLNKSKEQEEFGIAPEAAGLEPKCDQPVPTKMGEESIRKDEAPAMDALADGLSPSPANSSGYSVMGASENLSMQSGFADSGESQIVPASSDHLANDIDVAHKPACSEMRYNEELFIHELAGWLHGRFSGEKRNYNELDSKQRKEWRTDATIILNVYAKRHLCPMEPVSLSLKKCAVAVASQMACHATGAYSYSPELIAKAVLDTAKEQGVQFDYVN